MAETNVTAKVILDDRRPKANGQYPLKLRITNQRIRKYYNIHQHVTAEQFSKLYKSKEQNLIDIKNEIIAKESKANSIIKTLDVFTFEAFENVFEPKIEIANKVSKNIYDHFEVYIEKLKRNFQISTASNYSAAIKSFNKFKKKLLFNEVTSDFLNDYERFMAKEKKSNTTIGIYIRCLRTIYNQGIDKKIIDRDNYPFRAKDYKIPASNNTKKALNIQDIKAIFEYPTKSMSIEDKAKDFWIFSYLCNGINFKDICLLKWQNIDDGKITFLRAKTINTSKDKPKTIEIILSDETNRIIEKWGAKNDKNGFVFDILQGDLTPIRERDLIKGFTKTANKYLKRIGEKLELKLPLTTYVARHSFATILNTNNIPLLHISRSLGHSSLKTTENYLDSFKKDDVIGFNSNLMNW